MTRKNNGFSLVELIITVSVIAIIASIAWPMYEKQQLRNRRVDAISFMLDLKSQLERCYYSADAAKGFGEGTYEGCGYLVPATTPQGYYNLNFAVTTDGSLNPGKQGIGYTISATRVPGDLMDKDTDCRIFRITNTGAKTAEKDDASANIACWGSN